MKRHMDGGMEVEQQLIRSPFHSFTLSPLAIVLPTVRAERERERAGDGMGDVFFLETRSLSWFRRNEGLSLFGREGGKEGGEHYLLYCGGIKFMTARTPFLLLLRRKLLKMSRFDNGDCSDINWHFLSCRHGIQFCGGFDKWGSVK